MDRPFGRGRRVRRRIVGGMALGAATAATLGSSATPAAASGPTVVAHCTVFGPENEEDGRLTLSGFPPDTRLNFLAVLRTGSGRTTVFSGPLYVVTTDSTGSASTGSTGSGPPDRPVDVGVAVFVDGDGDSRWDPDGDRTLYRGDGTVTDCPSSVTLTPK